MTKRSYVLTAHKRLHPTKPGKYMPGWEIIDQDMTVVKTVDTKAEAQVIVTAQDIDAVPAKRPYRQGRTARAPEARMTPEALEALKEILDKDGVSYADWLEAKIKEDKKMTKEHTVKELIELISVTSYHYQMSKTEAEKLSSAKSAPAWASRYAEQVLSEMEQDDIISQSRSDK